MKHILTFILSLSFFASIGQVRLSDTANNGTFSYHLGSNFRGQYPKASCYLDRDASGAFAIRRVTGAVVTPYVSMSNYELNGEVDTVFSSYIEKLNGIIMLSCGGVAPVETFAYCGSAVASYFWKNDTSNNVGGFYSINTFFVDIADSLQSIEYIANSNANCCGNPPPPYTNYPFPGQTGLLGGCEKDYETSPYTCDSIVQYSATFDGESIVEIVSADCVMGATYGIDTVSISTTEFSEFQYQFVTLGSDTSLVVDFMVRQQGFSVCYRPLGVNISDLDLDTISGAITIVAYPSKRINVTYAASSFKIEKIAFADISAGTISGSSYNPNLGEQSNTFSLTTGKNTFKVSVEDTDGNIAYSIFQVTKTAL